MATVHFGLCLGADIRLCNSCLRLSTNHPAAAADPHQQFIGAVTSGERCSTWKPIPAVLPARETTSA